MAARIGRLVVATLSAIWVSASAHAQSISDGDTLKIGGVTYRLWGIDAPELAQTCGDGWPAGRIATTRLLALIQGKSVTCSEKDRDRYGRVVAVCYANGEDLGATLVREGLAWAFVRYSQKYTVDEHMAEAKKLGVHGHGCLPAWEWRAEHRR